MRLGLHFFPTLQTIDSRINTHTHTVRKSTRMGYYRAEDTVSGEQRPEMIKARGRQVRSRFLFEGWFWLEPIVPSSQTDCLTVVRRRVHRQSADEQAEL